MACNLIYIHLLSRCEHAAKCEPRRCAPDCGFEQFSAWLEAPLLPSDVVADARFRARREQLLRGEIPT